MKLLPRAGLFAMLGVCTIGGWFLAPWTTEAWVTLTVGTIITAYIIKDRWFS